MTPSDVFSALIAPMRHHNLSDWSLRHRTLMMAAMLILLIGGIFAYLQLPQREDPEFTFKVALVRAPWPGANTNEIERRLTGPVEHALRDIPWLDNVSSYTHAGEAVVFVTLKDAMPPGEVPHSWQVMRAKLAAMRSALPPGAGDLQINDEFGTTFGSLFAFTAPNATQAEQVAAFAQQEFRGIPGVAKAELVGNDIARMRYDGTPAIGVAVAMARDGDAIALGKRLRDAVEHMRASLAPGVQIHAVADQPKVVHDALARFMQSLIEALAIVLAVSFLSLGGRAGMVVALSIPLVLAGTFLLMLLFGIPLHRVSVGALIIAIGLLVDDAMIAVEMMVVKLEEGWSKAKAAGHAYRSTAFPMLTGTLVTAAAFLPVGLAKSSAGEYTASLCAVVTIALLVSWLVAVFFTPLIGFSLLREHTAYATAQYQSRVYVRLRQLVVTCLRFRKTVIAATLCLFALALYGFTKVEQQFFPPSERPELLLDVWLPEGAPLKATLAATQEIEQSIKDVEGIAYYTSYVGSATPRFYLMMETQPPASNYAQLVIVTRDVDARERALKRIRNIISTRFPDSGLRVSRLENGPPVGYPIQFRVRGSDVATLDKIATEVMRTVQEDGRTRNVNRDAVTPQDGPGTLVWHLDGQPVVTVRADVPDDVSATAVSQAIDQKLAGLRAKLPAGYRIESGGVSSDSGQATSSVLAVLPLTDAIILALLALQLRSLNLVALVILTAPLGVIGVTAALLAGNVPFGFVAMLGMVSLAGMIMRNSVILIDQIDQDMARGLSRHDAIIESTVRRARPILLTAAAAILAMIPLVTNVFWGPLSIVVMGGLFVATLLTLLILPALYAAWYRVRA